MRVGLKILESLRLWLGSKTNRGIWTGSSTTSASSTWWVWPTPSGIWDRTIAINQTGVFLGLQAVAAIIIRQKSGSIINISSIVGSRGAIGAFAYVASKLTVLGMTKSAAQESSPYGIRVNAIHPRLIETKIVDESSRKGINESIRERIPMGHFADASEVANLALFLAFGESSY